MTKHPAFAIPPSGITTRIALLSLLSLHAMHGYELRQTLEARHLHRFADVRYGSIYRGLQQMAREGLLAEDGEEQAGNRPKRTLYKITEQGMAELKHLLRQAWAEPVLLSDPVELALRLHMLLPQAEIIALLHQRLAALDDIAAHLAQAEADVCQRVQTDNAPAIIATITADMFKHRQAMLATERSWVTHVLSRFEAGDYNATEAEIAQIRAYGEKRLKDSTK
ncbi:MAG: PadR family transcriptional regulator [Armatimonadetes bacterium]|nr:PadR family transcriptional regulator [Anaerolineae bacterium]